MKTTIKLFALAMLTLVAFSACNDEKPSKSAKNSFKDMFPGASRVDWDIEYGYHVAEFRHDGHEKEAWFDSDGNWLLTETDLGTGIPEVVKPAFDASDYTYWPVDDVDYIEHVNQAPFYVVEVEKGETEKDMFFSADGELLEIRNGNGDYDIRPYGN